MSTSANNSGPNYAVTIDDREDFISKFNSELDAIAEKRCKKIVAKRVKKIMDAVTLNDTMKSVLEEALINALSKPMKQVYLSMLTKRVQDDVLRRLTEVVALV